MATTRARPEAASTFHLDPFLFITQRIADAGFSQVVWVACDPHLLDCLLPLAYSEAGHIIVAAVPGFWLSSTYAHRRDALVA